jgi:hypoxanthine-guanine phosphoribosyltransferase
MAYFNQERKAQKAPEIKAVMKKYGIKGSIGVRNHSTLVVNIKEGKIDFIGNFNRDNPEYPARDYIQVNEYHVDRTYSGKARNFLNELLKVMNKGNHDRSDIQTDYFDVGWYTDVNIGNWSKPYLFTK